MLLICLEHTWADTSLAEIKGKLVHQSLKKLFQ